MPFLPRRYHRLYAPLNREAQFSAMCDVMELLESARKELTIECRDGAKFDAVDLHGAFNDGRARSVKLSVRTTHYRICVKAGFTPLTIEVTAFGRRPRKLLRAIAKEIRPYALPDDEGRWPMRLWSWFRADVLHGIVAGLVVAGLLTAFGWLVGRLI
ncbi:hypothetical protein GCM10022419_066980 [Nonomuraea rosea]|uniref:Uncharacterized protein n=1 Tax=Nonomuraea rosea TaxID=638574 RepID=A0ABP6Y2F2_9ACTN